MFLNKRARAHNQPFTVDSFADDNAISSCGELLDDILHNVKLDLGYISKWLKVNSLKSSPCKFQFIILENNADVKINLFLDRNKGEKHQEFVLFTATIDDKLTLNRMLKITNYTRLNGKENI